MAEIDSKAGDPEKTGDLGHKGRGDREAQERRRRERRLAARTPAILSCQHCGTEFERPAERGRARRKFCETCRAPGARRTVGTYKKPDHCLRCGDSLDGVPFGRLREYCPDCSVERLKETNAIHHARKGADLSCVRCGIGFSSRYFRKTCGPDCQSKWVGTIGSEQNADRIKWLDCLGCGVRFRNLPARLNRKYCTRACYFTRGIGKLADQPDRSRLAGRITNRVRLTVYRRDQGVCQICFTPVDMAATSRTPLSPSLDHITPLSQGGTHEIGNLQLAHHRCNSLRRDRALNEVRFLPASEGGF